MSKNSEHSAMIGILVLSVLLVAVVWNSDERPSKRPQSQETNQHAGTNASDSLSIRESDRPINNVVTRGETPGTPPKQERATIPTQPAAKPKPIPVKPVLSEEEFFERQRTGGPITNCAIDAIWLAKALLRTEDATDKGGSSVAEPVILNDVDVKGDFVLKQKGPLAKGVGVTLPTRPTNSSVVLVLMTCRFFGNVDLACNFKKEVLFLNCDFEKQVTISNCRFDIGLGIASSRFHADFGLQNVELPVLELKYNTASRVTLSRCKVEGKTRIVFTDERDHPTIAAFYCFDGMFKGPADFSGGAVFKLPSVQDRFWR